MTVRRDIRPLRGRMAEAANSVRALSGLNEGGPRRDVTVQTTTRYRALHRSARYRGSAFSLKRLLLRVRRLEIDDGLRQLRQLLVGPLVFLEVLAEQLLRLLESEELGVRAQRPVRRDLVVLDLLGRADQRRVHHVV